MRFGERLGVLPSPSRVPVPVPLDPHFQIVPGVCPPPPPPPRPLPDRGSLPPQSPQTLPPPPTTARPGVREARGGGERSWVGDGPGGLGVGDTRGWGRPGDRARAARTQSPRAPGTSARRSALHLIAPEPREESCSLLPPQDRRAAGSSPLGSSFAKRTFHPQGSKLPPKDGAGAPPP